MSVIPQFAKGSSTKVQAAIDAGVLSYPAYVYETDTNKLAFINADLSINHIVGDNIITVKELPNPKDGNPSCLYVCDDILYTFDGEKFHPQTNDITEEVIEAIQQNLDDLTNKVDALAKDNNIIKDIFGDKLFSQAISLDDYIKEIVNESVSQVSLNWGEF